MTDRPAAPHQHRVAAMPGSNVVEGRVRYAPVKSLWLASMAAGALAGGTLTFSLPAFVLFLASTAVLLLFGHSLGSHRKLIHDSFGCPKWLEYLLVYLGVQVGLSGPLGLLRQHELRDYAQRLPDCHDYLRHGRGFWRDGWWQLHCELELAHPPTVRIESAIAADRFYRFLERTWMLQQLPWALLFYAWGGWGFVCWGVCARVTAGVCGHWLIGYFAHNHGAMHFRVDGAAVQGRNIPLASLLTMGECWHNNHHAFPGSARLGLHAGEWDPGWWALCLLRRCGLAWRLRLPHELAARPELVALAPPMPQPTPSTLHRPAPAARLAWPSSVASTRLLRLLCGAGVELHHDPAAPRLTFDAAGSSTIGLPALLAAIARRNAPARACARALLPAAVLIERARTAATT
jgi:stearoyl-CoA desaturase (delta-9 desaturase)